MTKLRQVTTIGELVEAIYDAALEEYMDEVMARRIAMQFLLRKLRLHDEMAKEQKDLFKKSKKNNETLRS